jgi:hypothetical protein
VKPVKNVPLARPYYVPRHEIWHAIMDTISVNICYRPLRIGWAIAGGDIEAFRHAVRLSHTLWGGRFNPIIAVDQEEEALELVNLFRVDLVLPIGDSPAVRGFASRFSYLINPFFGEGIFINGGKGQRHAQLLDIQNMLIHLRDVRDIEAIRKGGVRIYSWQTDDPLANVFLMQLGSYPTVEETGIDYVDMLAEATYAKEHSIDNGGLLQANMLDFPTIAALSRYRLQAHYGIQNRWNWPGYFVGDAADVGDLISFWNLRATDIPLLFVDSGQIDRYADVIPAWEKRMQDMIAPRSDEWERRLGVWSRKDIDQAGRLLGNLKLLRCRISMGTWNGLNVRAPMMHFGEASALGVFGREGDKPRISFALPEKPFSGDVWFQTQHVVASLSFLGGLYGDEQYTLDPPYVPELNEFYSRTMHFEYNKLRIEPGRVGVIIDAHDHDSFLCALPAAELVERVFEISGYTARLSPAGLIARQLVTQLGGLQGARVFKIPGVRRLLKTHGPMATFTKEAALQLIASKDPQNPNARFADHQNLFIKTRLPGRKLQPDDVFAYLVEKGLFRIGAELKCSNCSMRSWYALDSLKQRVVCELCGREYDATRQLVEGVWDYRRSGILGAEKNAQGAIPVALTLQQLHTTLHGVSDAEIYSPSLEIERKDGGGLPPCEIDFVWISSRSPFLHDRKPAVILGECKDSVAMNFKDVENLRRLADSIPRERFDTFVLLSKLAPFTAEEIDLARTLNDRYRQRAILLTERELEPYRIYERTKKEYPISEYGSTPEDLARVTFEVYFREKPTESKP